MTPWVGRPCRGFRKEVAHLDSPKRSETDAAFLLTIGSFLLTAELFCLQLCFGALLLAIEAFLLTVRAFCLQLSFFAYNGRVCLKSTSTDCER